jgi:flavin reductase (DIM6/NTAB) family NADH-FMN oxidoreductase RutF
MLFKTIPLVRSNGETTNTTVIIGEVVNIHIDDGVVVDGMIDIARMRPIARLGYMNYSVVDNVFTMLRPD